MSLFSTEKPTLTDQKQSRLMRLAALFLFLYSLILMLAPAARLHDWNVEYRWNHWIGFAVWLVGMALVNQQLIRLLPDRDPFLFPVGALLTGWGLLTVWRLDFTMGARQTIWLAVCLTVITVGLRIPDLLVLLRRYKYLWLTGGLLLTGLTFLLGVYPGGVGPRLWLGCCGVYLQPSEPLKLLLIIYLSAYLADRLPVSFNLPQLLTPTIILIGMALALLVGQKDLGTASLFILIYTVVVYIASQKRRTLVFSLLVLLAAGVTGYLLFAVVRIRVDAWLNPWLDPAGGSYQIIQSLMAVASGGILGRGPGLGSPGIVPVAHSDFIFSSIAEETGLLGAVGLFMLFAILVGRGFRAALYAPNNFRRYLAAGITAYLVMQGIFIIGGNLRLLPLTGVTLPFVSYGGSSLLTAYISLLILILVSSQGEEETAPLRNTFPYMLSSAGLFAGLFVLALVTGWWAVARRDGLLARPENPRRAITERFVMRGSLLDRSNAPLNRSVGRPGELTRVYEYPALANTTGHNSPLYGQSGLEAGLDDNLRGLQGNPATMIIADDLIYGQTPPGLDVRLTIDLVLQQAADELMQGHQGALVLMDASNGEILVMASHPNYDPNRLDEELTSLLQDPTAPLLNRATQGQYPPGTALGPFLLSYASRGGALAITSSTRSYDSVDGMLSCAVEPQPPVTSGKLVGSGCPAPLVALGQNSGAAAINDLFASLGFYAAPDLPMPVAPPSSSGVDSVEQAAVGQGSLTVTPLQMAAAAAALTNNGMRPTPQIVLAELRANEGWIVQTAGPREETLLAGGTRPVTSALGVENQRYWQAVAQARSSQDTFTWYLAGTLPEWRGVPLALALILEEDNPALAQSIGQTLLQRVQE